VSDDGEKKPETGTPSAEASKPGIHVELVGRTDVGLVREHNEDSYLVVRLDDSVRDPETLRRHTLGERGTLLVVCDGMGGAAAGEVASNMAVESLATTMLAHGNSPSAPTGTTDDGRTGLARKLRMASKDANTEIFREARNNLSRSGMGTTMTAVLLQGRHAVIAQVGDSRAYVWRDGRFTQVTRDQSLVNQLLETGHITPEQAKFFEHSNVILQALGVQEEVEVQLSQVELRRGDRFLVCSDGLVGVVTDEEIGAVMGACEDPDECCRILIEMANGAGGPDNISVIVAKVDGETLPPPTAADALEYQLWRIDPDQPPEPSPEDPPTRPVLPSLHTGAPTGYRPNPSRNPTIELVSMAVVFGLVLGSVLTGAVIYRNGVTCQVEAKQPGLAVLADGRDTGVRTPPAGEGTVRLRLKPGHHTLSLRGQGAPEGTREVDVSRGAACELSFAPPAASPAAAAPPLDEPPR
jgi:PPM family protein phosphatase